MLPLLSSLLGDRIHGLAMEPVGMLPLPGSLLEQEVYQHPGDAQQA